MSQITSSTSSTPVAASPSLRIIKIATCPTCTGKAKLTYHLGCKADKQLYLRISSNTGGGFFSAEWVAYQSIQATLASHPADNPITSTAFIPLFQGKSTNTPGFLLAALVNEGLLKLAGDKQRGYHILSSDSFDTEMSKLMASNIDLKVAPAVPITRESSASKHKQSKPTIATNTPS
jgi:hypothetical protein